ncbi:MAG: TolC family protein, partial [Planctomycetota bacterium]|nr:TolC family protein [Planctomycetota bacterium]
RRVRLDEVNRQVFDRERRQEETERLARREQELDGQITRLQQALAQAEARARPEDAAVAAVRARPLAIGPSDDPTLRSYQTTLDDHHRRLDLARKRRDAARADLEALQANLTGERDTRAALVLALRDRIEAAHRIGARSVLELIDAQMAYREVLRQQASRRADYWRAIHQLNAVLGREVLP